MHARSRFARLGRPTLYAIIAAMLLPLLLSTTAPQATAWVDTDYSRMRAITITAGENGIPENYQVSVFLAYDSDMAFENFQDSRFYWENSTGEYLLSYWFENVNSGENVENAWIKLPEDVSLAADQSADNLKWYYGNASAVSVENGDATFEFFDDFPGSSVDTSKWTKYGSPSVSGGILTSGTGGTAGVTTISSWDNTHAFRTRVTSQVASASSGFIGWGEAGQRSYEFDLYGNFPTVEVINALLNGATGFSMGHDGSAPHIYDAKRSGTSCEMVTDGTSKGTLTGGYGGSLYIHITGDGASAEIKVDWVLVRECISPEPTVSVGSEESLGLSVTSIIADNSLIDRAQDDTYSNAEVATRVTVRVYDNNGHDNIENVLISIRDVADTVIIENVEIISTLIEVDENTADFYYDYNPADNLGNSQLGLFDVNVWTYDDFGENDSNNWGGEGANIFTVDDLTSTINFNPTSPNVGWNLTVSGTHSRIVGSVSIDASWLVDNKHGQFTLGASDTYNETYTISNAIENENVSVTLRAHDSTLDGVTTSSYEVNENLKFQVWVRFEENYALAGWIPDENRVIDLLFEWDGGTYPYTLTANPENIAVPSGGASINIVKFTDNDDYWRYFIPPYSGGNLNFIIVEDISDVEQYRFFLQDYTGQYIPPNGQMLIKSWIGTTLADINGDYWGADWRTTAWLVTGTQYQIWVQADDAPLRMVGPIDAVTPSEEKTIVVQMIVENVIPIFDDVYWNAWRIDNGTIRMEYQDNLDNTIGAHVGIYDENRTMQAEYLPDNEWFIVTWIGANGAESYEVVLTVQHGEHGDFVMTMPIGTLDWGPPGVGGGVSDPFDLPEGLTLSAIGSVILVIVMGLSFDVLRVQIGMLAMALTTIFCWQMGFLPLPGPYGGSFTATLILVMAVLFALTWRRGK